MSLLSNNCGTTIFTSDFYYFCYDSSSLVRLCVPILTKPASRSESSHEISELTSQVHVLTKQRDTALQQVSSAEDSAASCQSSLSNLQIVLEQFQQGQYLFLGLEPTTRNTAVWLRGNFGFEEILC